MPPCTANTENAANILASKLAARGVKKIAMYDVSATHPSVIVSEAFRCSHLVFASTTYNAGIFCNMETALLDIAAHNLQNRTVALIENGSWAATAGKLMAELLGKLKNITVLDNKLTIKSSLKEGQPRRAGRPRGCDCSIPEKGSGACAHACTGGKQRNVQAQLRPVCAHCTGWSKGQRLHHQHRTAAHKRAHAHLHHGEQGELYA